MFLELSDLYRAAFETHESELHTQAELARANLVATMGYLAASIVHELKQPIAAMIQQTVERLALTEPPSADFGRALPKLT